MRLNTSDWVTGRTGDGELIHGYIEKIDRAQSLAKVQVAQSDNESIVGSAVTVREQWLRLLEPVAVEEDEAYLRNMIDLALSVKDEAWFMELTAQLQAFYEAAEERAARGDWSHESEIQVIR